MQPLWFSLRMWVVMVLIVAVLYIGPRRQAKTFIEVLNDV